MSQAHKGSQLMLKGLVVGTDSNTSFLAHYDITENDVLAGIAPTGNYAIVPYEGKFGGGISIEKAATNYLSENSNTVSVPVNAGSPYTLTIYSVPSTGNNVNIEGFLYNTKTNNFTDTKTSTVVNGSNQLTMMVAGTDATVNWQNGVGASTLTNVSTGNSNWQLDKGTTTSANYSIQVQLAKEGTNLDATYTGSNLDSTLTGVTLNADGSYSLAKQGSDKTQAVTSGSDWTSSGFGGVNTDPYYTSGDLMLSRSPKSGWNLSLTSWAYRVPITLQNDCTYSSYHIAKAGEPVRITVSSAHIATGGADIRIVDDSGSIISHRIVAADDVNHAYTIQFETGSIAADATVTYYVYYGNSSATSTSISNQYTAYEPFTPDSIGTNYQTYNRYGFWTNPFYFEVWNASGNGYSMTQTNTTVSSTAYGATLPWSFPIATGTGNILTSSTTSYLSTYGGRTHVYSSSGYTTTSITYNNTGAYYFIGLINEYQKAIGWRGTTPANGNLPSGYKYAYDSQDTASPYTVRRGSTVLYQSGRVHINIDTDMVQSVSGGGGSAGIKTGTNLYYASWAAVTGSCYVIILDPLVITIGAEEYRDLFSTNGTWTSPVYDMRAVVAASSSNISITANSNASTSWTLSVSTSSDNVTWSAYSTIKDSTGTNNTLPYANYIKFQLALSTTDTTQTPVIHDFTWTYYTGYYSTGTAVTNGVSLSSVVKSNGTAQILWTGTVPTGTTATLEYAFASDGVAYGAWTSMSPMTSWLQIAAITKGQSLSTAMIKFRVTLNASSTLAATPNFTYFQLSLGTAYKTSGSWTSPLYDISTAKWVASSLVNWTSTLPANTSVMVSTSVDGGVTWQTATNGGGILNIPSNVSGTGLMIQATLSTTDVALTPTFTGYGYTVNPRYAPSGTVVFPDMSITQAVWAKSSIVNWNNTLPAGTSMTVSVARSTDSGTTFDAYTAQSLNAAIANIGTKYNCANGKIRVKVDFTSDTNGTVTPALTSLAPTISTGYLPSGNYMSPVITVASTGDLLYTQFSSQTLNSNYTTTAPSAKFSYAKNSGAWVQFNYGDTLPVVTGDKVQFKIDLDSGDNLSNTILVNYFEINSTIYGTYPNRKTLTFNPYTGTSPLNFTKNGNFNWQLESGSISTGYVNGSRGEGNVTYLAGFTLNSTAGTISFWFKPTGVSTSGTLFMVAPSIFQMTYSGTGIAMNGITVSQTINSGIWYNAVYTWDNNATTKQSLYLFDASGDMLGLTTSPLNPPAINSGYQTFTLGNDGTNSANIILDELRIDMIARSQDEVQAWAYSNNPFYPRGIFGAAY